MAAAERAGDLAGAVDTWMSHQVDDAVYWIETQQNRQHTTTRLASSPIDIAPILSQLLFDRVPSAILTSATLAVGRDNFEFSTGRLGISNARHLRLGSPFDYQSQCRLVLPSKMPDPQQATDYTKACAEAIRRHVTTTHGGTLVLFTSYSMLKGDRSRSHRLVSTKRSHPVLPGWLDVPHVDARTVPPGNRGPSCSEPRVSGKESTCRARRWKQ
ncbi:MAG: hypothetical protein CM1200mP2_34150 [Planctomycetaceae bacterium]|nr:MAG: hypothetical protein CM1200mP2_34150 [Planctomycetaceae bacterium]